MVESGIVENGNGGKWKLEILMVESGQVEILMVESGKPHKNDLSRKNKNF